MGSAGVWLNLLGYALPGLIGLGIALALLLGSARPGPGRRLGLIGISLMLVASVLSMGLVIAQNLVLLGNTDGAAAMSRSFALIGVAHVLLNVLSMGGVVTLVWGLCRQSHATPQAR